VTYSETYSVHAADAMQNKIKEVRQLLKMIGIEVQKYESLTMVNPRQVGEMAEIERLLDETWEFISEADA
jgi:hypothetical protein